MEIPFRENYFWKRSSGVFYATKVSHAFFINPSLRGFCKPFSQFCTPGWGITTFLWSGQPSLSPFSRFSAVASLLIRGFRDFAPRLTCPRTVCHSIPVWLPQSGCLRLMPFAKAIRLLLHAPPHWFAQWPLCVITFSPLARVDHFLLSDLGVYLLDLPSLTFSGTPHVKSVYRNSLKGHSFRTGAASTAAAAGLPDWLIKVLGRWSSDCYQLYIRTPRTVLLSAAPRMASVAYL